MSEADDTLYHPGDTLTLNEDMEFRASWLPVVSFDGNGADSGSVDEMSMPEDGTLTLPDNAYKRKGFRFAGWSANAQGTDPQKTGTEISVTEPTSFYAAWRAVVSYDANGGKGKMKPSLASVAGGLKLPSSTFTKAGYLFAGWSTTPTGDTTLPAQKKTKVDGPTTFYAVWRAAASFKGNGATGGNTEEVGENTKGIVTLPACGFTREGCTFIGWYKAGKGFESKPYYKVKDLHQPGDKLSLKGKPATLYACWKYDDAVLEKLSVEKVERTGSEGVKSLFLLIRNDSAYEMELNGQMRYVNAWGEKLETADIFSPVVSPGETVLQACSVESSEDGSFEYSLLGRPSRWGTKSASLRMSTKELSVANGLLSVELTNTSEDTVHLLNVQAYATQSNASGGFAYAPGEGYDEVLAPGATTTVTFGSQDWNAQWGSFSRSYYFDGYAE
jgi:hypothetical protein